jgi:hypothetical protein
VTTISSSTTTALVLNNGTQNPVTIAGAGTINSAGAYAIQASDGVAWTITNSGLVTATGAGAIGIDASADSQGVTLTNAGTIGGASGAVLLGSGDDRVIVVPGAVFSGTVDGAAGANTLEFASAVSHGAMTGLGSKYLDFQSVTVNAGAY